MSSRLQQPLLKAPESITVSDAWTIYCKTSSRASVWSAITHLLTVRTQKPTVSIKRIQMVQSSFNSAKDRGETSTDKNSVLQPQMFSLNHFFLANKWGSLSLQTQRVFPDQVCKQAMPDQLHYRFLTFIRFILQFLATTLLDPLIHVLFCYFNHFSLFQSPSIRIIHQRNISGCLNKRFIHQNCNQKSTGLVKAL